MLLAELSEADLQKYFIGDRRDFSSIEDIYEQFIHSAQNYQSMPKVIKYDERRDSIKKTHKNFDVQRIKEMDVDEFFMS